MTEKTLCITMEWRADDTFTPIKSVRFFIPEGTLREAKDVSYLISQYAIEMFKDLRMYAAD